MAEAKPLYTYSNKSKRVLATCDERLQRLFYEVIKHVNCTILVGYRTEDEQNEAFRLRLSKLPWPKSKHNRMPSLAVDAAPYPIDWQDFHAWYYFSGLVIGIAAGLGIKIRWGGDWDGDGDLKDNTFMDLAHFELVD